MAKTRKPKAMKVRKPMDPVRARLQTLCPGVELTENLRFNPGEKANDPAFVQQLIAGFDRLAEARVVDRHEVAQELGVVDI